MNEAPRYCETCGERLIRHRHPSGQRERDASFAARRHCGHNCRREAEAADGRERLPSTLAWLFVAGGVSVEGEEAALRIVGPGGAQRVVRLRASACAAVIPEGGPLVSIEDLRRAAHARLVVPAVPGEEE